MRNVASSHDESPRETAEFAAGAFFVDLDLTLLRGTVAQMTDNELAASMLHTGVLRQIAAARAAGIPVVMVTRNDAFGIERFFRAHPETRSLFTDTIACTSGDKSAEINAWLQAHNIPSDQAVFADDTERELADVRARVEGALACEPDQFANLSIRRATTTRRRTRRVFDVSDPLQAHEVPLAA